MGIMATEDFNSYSTYADIYNRTGALKWSKRENFDGYLAPDDLTWNKYYEGRFVGSGKYIMMIWQTGLFASLASSALTMKVGLALKCSAHAYQGELAGFYNAAYVEFWYNTGNVSPPYNTPIRWFHGAVSVSWNSGLISIRDNENFPIWESGSGVVPLNAWSFLEVAMTIGNPGSVSIRLNGQDIVGGFPGNYLSTGASASPTCNEVAIRSDNNWWWLLLDDIYFAD